MDREKMIVAKENALGSLYDLNEYSGQLKLSEDERLRIQHMIQEISRIIQARFKGFDASPSAGTERCGCSGCGCQ